MPLVVTFNLLYGFENNQKPVFKWLLNGVVLATNNTVKYTLDTDPNMSTLTVLTVSGADSGVYECQAKNLYGNASQTVLVRVKSRLAPLW